VQLELAIERRDHAALRGKDMLTIRHLFAFSGAALLVAACEGPTSSDAGGICIPAGTYKEHLTAEPGSTCGSVPDVTITYPVDVTRDQASFSVDAGSGCTSSFDAPTCTSSEVCTSSGPVSTITLSTTLTLNGTAGSGKETLTTTDPMGKVVSNCAYDVALAKP
jgi:hypothetical protein